MFNFTPPIYYCEDAIIGGIIDNSQRYKRCLILSQVPLCAHMYYI